MQATNRIRNKTKPSQLIPTLVSILLNIKFYQVGVTSFVVSILFCCLSSSIMGTLVLTPQYLNKKQACLIKKDRYFNYK